MFKPTLVEFASHKKEHVPLIQVLSLTRLVNQENCTLLLGFFNCKARIAIPTSHLTAVVRMKNNVSQLLGATTAEQFKFHS